MKGNNENENGHANDNNNHYVKTNLSTSPPRKKQCLVIPSKPDDEGLQGSEPELVVGTLGAGSKDATAQKQGVGKREKQHLDMVQDQMTEETCSDSDSDSEYDSDSESDDEILDHTDEDHGFVRYDCLRDKRVVYVICLKEKIRSRSECKEYLKKVGCDGAHFAGGSKLSPSWFYARLRVHEAKKLARVEGVRTLTSSFCVTW